MKVTILSLLSVAAFGLAPALAQKAKPKANPTRTYEQEHGLPGAQDACLALSKMSLNHQLFMTQAVDIYDHADLAVDRSWYNIPADEKKQIVKAAYLCASIHTQNYTTVKNFTIRFHDGYSDKVVATCDKNGVVLHSD